MPRNSRARASLTSEEANRFDRLCWASCDRGADAHIDFLMAVADCKARGLALDAIWQALATGNPWEMAGTDPAVSRAFDRDALRLARPLRPVLGAIANTNNTT